MVLLLGRGRGKPFWERNGGHGGHGGQALLALAGGRNRLSRALHLPTAVGQ